MMDTITTHHRDAMRFAAEADTALAAGNQERARELYQRAFEAERLAAELVARGPESEPTRSVLHRSAASLAVECGEFNEAGRLITAGLEGSPPPEISRELEQLRHELADAASGSSGGGRV